MGKKKSSTSVASLPKSDVVVSFPLDKKHVERIQVFSSKYGSEWKQQLTKNAKRDFDVVTLVVNNSTEFMVPKELAFEASEFLYASQKAGDLSKVGFRIDQDWEYLPKEERTKYEAFMDEKEALNTSYDNDPMYEKWLFMDVEKREEGVEFVKWKEPSESNKFVLNQIPVNVMEIIFDYMITGEANMLQEDALDLIIALDFLKIGRFYKLVLDWLSLHLSPENALAIFHVARMLDERVLREQSWALLGLREFDLCVLNSPHFETLDVGTALELFRRRKQISLCCEDVFFKALVKFCKSKETKKSSHIRDFLLDPSICYIDQVSDSLINKFRGKSSSSSVTEKDVSEICKDLWYDRLKAFSTGPDWNHVDSVLFKGKTKVCSFCKQLSVCKITVSGSKFCEYCFNRKNSQYGKWRPAEVESPVRRGPLFNFQKLVGSLGRKPKNISKNQPFFNISHGTNSETNLGVVLNKAKLTSTSRISALHQREYRWLTSGTEKVKGLENSNDLLPGSLYFTRFVSFSRVESHKRIDLFVTGVENEIYGLGSDDSGDFTVSGQMIGNDLILNLHYQSFDLEVFAEYKDGMYFGRWSKVSAFRDAIPGGYSRLFIISKERIPKAHHTVEEALQKPHSVMRVECTRLRAKVNEMRFGQANRRDFLDVVRSANMAAMTKDSTHKFSCSLLGANNFEICTCGEKLQIVPTHVESRNTSGEAGPPPGLDTLVPQRYEPPLNMNPGRRSIRLSNGNRLVYVAPPQVDAEVVASLPDEDDDELILPSIAEENAERGTLELDDDNDRWAASVDESIDSDGENNNTMTQPRNTASTGGGSTMIINPLLKEKRCFFCGIEPSASTDVDWKVCTNSALAMNKHSDFAVCSSCTKLFENDGWFDVGLARQNYEILTCHTGHRLLESDELKGTTGLVCRHCGNFGGTSQNRLFSCSKCSFGETLCFSCAIAPKLVVKDKDNEDEKSISMGMVRENGLSFMIKGKKCVIQIVPSLQVELCAIDTSEIDYEDVFRMDRAFVIQSDSGEILWNFASNEESLHSRGNSLTLPKTKDTDMCSDCKHRLDGLSVKNAIENCVMAYRAGLNMEVCEHTLHYVVSNYKAIFKIALRKSQKLSPVHKISEFLMELPFIRLLITDVHLAYRFGDTLLRSPSRETRRLFRREFEIILSSILKRYQQRRGGGDSFVHIALALCLAFSQTSFRKPLLWDRIHRSLVFDLKIMVGLSQEKIGDRYFQKDILKSLSSTLVIEQLNMALPPSWSKFLDADEGNMYFSEKELLILNSVKLGGDETIALLQLNIQVAFKFLGQLIYNRNKSIEEALSVCKEIMSENKFGMPEVKTNLSRREVCSVIEYIRKSLPLELLGREGVSKLLDLCVAGEVVCCFSTDTISSTIKDALKRLENELREDKEKFSENKFSLFMNVIRTVDDTTKFSYSVMDKIFCYFVEEIDISYLKEKDLLKHTDVLFVRRLFFYCINNHSIPQNVLESSLKLLELISGTLQKTDYDFFLSLYHDQYNLDLPFNVKDLGENEREFDLKKVAPQKPLFSLEESKMFAVLGLDLSTPLHENNDKNWAVNPGKLEKFKTKLISCFQSKFIMKLGKPTRRVRFEEAEREEQNVGEDDALMTSLEWMHVFEVNSQLQFFYHTTVTPLCNLMQDETFSGKNDSRGRVVRNLAFYVHFCQEILSSQILLKADGVVSGVCRFTSLLIHSFFNLSWAKLTNEISFLLFRILEFVLTHKSKNVNEMKGLVSSISFESITKFILSCLQTSDASFSKGFTLWQQLTDFIISLVKQAKGSLKNFKLEKYFEAAHVLVESACGYLSTSLDSDFNFINQKSALKFLSYQTRVMRDEFSKTTFYQLASQSKPKHQKTFLKPYEVFFKVISNSNVFQPRSLIASRGPQNLKFLMEHKQDSASSEEQNTVVDILSLLAAFLDKGWVRPLSGIVEKDSLFPRLLHFLSVSDVYCLFQGKWESVQTITLRFIRCAFQSGLFFSTPKEFSLVLSTASKHLFRTRVKGDYTELLTHVCKFLSTISHQLPHIGDWNSSFWPIFNQVIDMVCSSELERDMARSGRYNTLEIHKRCLSITLVCIETIEQFMSSNTSAANYFFSPSGAETFHNLILKGCSFLGYTADDTQSVRRSVLSDMSMLTFKSSIKTRIYVEAFDDFKDKTSDIDVTEETVAKAITDLQSTVENIVEKSVESKPKDATEKKEKYVVDALALKKWQLCTKIINDVTSPSLT